MGYRQYDISLTINGVRFNRLEIDDHYEVSHKEHMTDELIIALVLGLHGHDFEAVKEHEDGLRVFVTEPLMHEEKPYRLVWFYYAGFHTLGVRTAFRTRRKK